MKIVFIAPANSIHTIRWVNALVNRGNQIYLISMANHSAEESILDRNVYILYLPVKGTKGYYLNAYTLARLVKKIAPDVINVHYASGYGTLARMAKLPRICLSVWGSDVYDFPYESTLKMYIIKRNLLYANRIASTSHAMACQVQNLIGKKKIAVTPFGVDTNKFKKYSEEKKYNFTVGIVKTLAPKYGVDTVIKAFYLFLKKINNNDNIHLIVYGKGSQKDELLFLCKKLHISDSVTFAGYISNEEVPYALNKMDIVCFGSRLDSESFGVSAVEAMACELPVIATNVAGFLEVIDNEENGFIVGKDNYEEMADKLFLLYQNPDLRRKVGTAARKKVLKLYDWEKNVDTMIEFYEKPFVDLKQ